MLKKNITYVDYTGTERTETFYFNLNKAELVELEVEYREGVSNELSAMLEKNDRKGIIGLITKMVKMAFGEKSPDGKRFYKNEQILANFTATEAYSDLVIELLSNMDKMREFMTGIMPAELRTKLNEQKTEETPVEEPGVIEMK